MAEILTPKERVELALQKKFVDKVPFTAFSEFYLTISVENPAMSWSRLVPQCAVERELRNRGFCLVEFAYLGYKTIRPNVKVISTVYENDGRIFVRTDYETPVGNLYNIKEIDKFTIWWHKRLFSSPDDYRAILFLINDTKVLPDYEAVEKAIRMRGGDAILRGDFGFEPLQDLITGDYFGTSDFCIQWMDNKDEILKLYNALVELRRQEYKIVADSPLCYICYGGNVSSQVISPENFKKYYITHYEEAAEILHKNGKVLACHFDADCKLFKEIIADTSIYIIEALHRIQIQI